MKRREFVSLAGTAAAAAAVGGVTPLLEACAGKPRPLGRKVIVLAIDGMDPRLTRAFMDRGLLPTFSAFASRNTFTTLGTSLPPQSPVAWSDFIAGAGPGVHGIFDFIHRDAKTLAPYLSISRSSPPAKTLKVGSLVLPLEGGKVENLRRGPCLWKILGDRDVPATVFKCPSNFPPTPARARTVSGMGTPDLRGTYGTFTYYTDDPPPNAKDFTGGECIPVRLWDNSFTGELPGPPNTFRAGAPLARARFTLQRDATRPLARVVFDGAEVVLAQGEWSDWIPVRFSLAGPLAHAGGIVRLYLKEVRPHFRLYVSPVNIDPLDAVLPVSTPKEFSADVAREAGRYATKGFPEDTKALSHGVFSDEEYMDQADGVLEESLVCLEKLLADYRDGFFYYYFSSVDQNTHMLWRAMDTHHPLYDPNASPRVKQALEHYYGAMDGALAQVLSKVDEDTTLFVISDHGFAPFYREFNLNTWLLDNGYLFLEDPTRRDETEFLDNIDWRRTRAYGLGLNALYLNLEGRETRGSVNPADAPALEKEIAAKLRAYVDAEAGARPVVDAYATRDHFRGPEAASAPEMVVGFAPGYRMSDDSATGEFPTATCTPRTDKWAGDHCIDPRHVPGVLFTNRPLGVPSPSLRDLAPTILKCFDVPIPRAMTGRNLLK